MQEYEKKLNDIILNSEIRVDSDPYLDVNLLDKEMEQLKLSLAEDKNYKK